MVVNACHDGELFLVGVSRKREPNDVLVALEDSLESVADAVDASRVVRDVSDDECDFTVLLKLVKFRQEPLNLMSRVVSLLN